MKHVCVCLLVALVWCAIPRSAFAQITTHSNTAPITINIGGPATPYPSVINVSGATTNINYVRVRLNGFAHTYPGDVVALLVAPTGQKVLLMNSNGGSTDVTSVVLDFATDAQTLLPGNQLVTGVYRTTTFASGNLPAPAPASPYSLDLATFNGLNANGTWTLYIVDVFSAEDAGSIASGWSITFNETVRQPEPIGNAFTYQGRLSGVPANSSVHLRFSLWNDPASADSLNLVGGPVTQGVTLDGNLFTTSVNFGVNIQRQTGLYLNIEVSTTGAGGPFTTLTPRQLITGVPLALQLKGVTVDTGNQVGIGGIEDPVYALEVKGRTRIRGEAGASSNSPGLWFASPSPSGNIVERAFVGQRDDNNVGFFTGGEWRLRVNANGNTWLGDTTDTAPPERLTVSGNIQLPVGNRVQFGAVGNFGSTAENTDAIFFARDNAATNVSNLRLVVGDDAVAPGLDAFSIGTVAGTAGVYTERFRFQSDGVASKPGGGTWAVLSDVSTKDHLTPLNGTLDKLLALHGYAYEYKPEFVAAGRALPGVQIGLVAQDVQRVFPDWVTVSEDGKLCVTERATTALMVEALRDLRTEKDRQLEALREQNLSLQRRLEALEQRLTKTNAEAPAGK